jgi:hypothetical protein
MHLQRLVSAVKMATFREVVLPKSNVSYAFFLWAKGLNAKDIHKKNVSCLRWEVFVAQIGSQLRQ